MKFLTFTAIGLMIATSSVGLATAQTNLPPSIYKRSAEDSLLLAKRAFGDGNYLQAYKEFVAAASAGSGEAAARVGEMYATGTGVDYSTSNAALWYEKAAEMGYVEAQYNIAVYYSGGVGVSQSDERALHWFRKAAAQGNTRAQEELVKLKAVNSQIRPSEKPAARQVQSSTELKKLASFRNMQAAQTAFDEKDYARAREIWRAAAAENNPMAMHKLGDLYDLGLGVSDDDQTAFNWYKKAAELKLPEAYVSLGDIYYGGYSVVPKSYETARDYYLKAAHQGMPLAMYNAGKTMIILGEQDKGYGWIYKAAERMNPEALLHLGYAHDTGKGPLSSEKEGQVVQSYAKAKAYYLTLANMGAPDAMFYIGMQYRKGHGVSKSEAMAQHWFMKAARLGPSGISGKIHLNESNTKILESAELRTLQGEASGGNVEAQLQLGRSYQTGLHGTKSPALAKHWLGKAASAGSDEALYSLASLQIDGTTQERGKARDQLTSLAQRRAIHPFYLENIAHYLRGKNFAEAESLMKAVADMEDVSPEFLMHAGNYFGQLFNTRNVNRHNLSDKNAQITYLTRAAELGHVEAQYFLGGAYDGPNMSWKGDYALARKWYGKAAEYEHLSAMTALANLYADGLGGAKDQTKAIALYTRAGELGHDMGTAYASVETYHKNRDDAEAERQRQVAAANRARQAREAKEQARQKAESRMQAAYSAPSRSGGFGGWLAAALINSGNQNYGNGNSYSSSSSSSYRSPSSSSSNYKHPFGGLNSHSREYHQRRSISNPVAYYQNRYD